MIRFNRIQYRFWVDNELQISKNIYNLSASAKISGPLNIDLLEKSLSCCIGEFKMLHSIIVTDDDGYPYWDVKESYTLPFHVISMPSDTSDDQLKQIISEKARTPFDLKQELPCKFYLYHLTEDNNVFVVVYHHCVIDGCGMQTVSERLSQIYNCLNKGVDIPQAVEDLDQRLIEFDKEIETNHKTQLEGVTTICNYLDNASFTTPIPLLNNETEISSKVYSFTLGSGFLQRCKKYCIANSQTLFRLFCASWGTTLCRMLNQDKVVLDHAISVRPKNLNNTIGTMINNLPLIIDLSDNVTTEQLLEAIHKGRRLMQKYSLVDYIDLMPELRKKFTSNYSTPPNILINYPISSNLANLEIDNCHTVSFIRTIMDLAETLGLHIYDDEEATCQIMYKSSIPPYFIQELANSFCFVLQQMTEGNKCVYDYPLITPERKELIIKQNEVKPFHIQKSLLQQLKKHSSNLADKEAIVCQSDSLTYNELNTLTDRIGQYIIQTRPERVAICLNRNIYTIPVILGVLKAGATYVPLDKDAPCSRKEYMLKDCEAGLVITDDGVEMPPMSCPIIKVKDLLRGLTDEHPLTYELPRTAYIIYTSGTTGVPKATPITTNALHQLVHNIIYHNKWIDEHDHVLQMANISFDASVVDIFTALYVGATIVMADDSERKDVGLLLDLLVREKVSFATIPPALMAILPIRSLPAMKTMVFAGEATSKEVFDRWQGKGIRIVNAYGPTENCVCSSFADINETSSPTNIGKPLTNVSCYVLDRNMQLLPYGVTGDLYLGGNQLTEGYLNQDALNKKKFFKNPYATKEQTEKNINQSIYKTGDIVYMKPDSSIEFMGRTDFQIKLNGHRIELEEIERHLLKHPAIEQAVTTIQTLTNSNKQLVAYIKTKVTDAEISTKELRHYLSNELPENMIPTKWVYVKNFELTTSGKIDRTTLPMPNTQETTNLYDDYVAPTTASEHILVRIFTKVLGNERISVTSNLFEDYGLDSIRAMSAIYESKSQGVELSVSTLYKNKSIRTSLLDNKTYPYYWLNDYDEKKPVIILACGLVYLQPYHHDLLELIKEKYTVLVLDSIHEFFFMKKECTFANLLANYMTILPKMLKGKKVLGVTGWCIGGEIALQLAVELKQAGIASPIVFSLDGYLHQEVDKNAPLFYMNFPNVPEEINKERERIKNEFIASIFFRPYSGKVYCFFADQFSKYPPNGEILTDEEVDFNYRSFKKNPDDWRRLQPGCIIQFIQDNHYTFLQKKNMVEVVKVMDKEREAFLKQK